MINTFNKITIVLFKIFIVLLQIAGSPNQGGWGEALCSEALVLAGSINQRTQREGSRAQYL